VQTGGTGGHDQGFRNTQELIWEAFKCVKANGGAAGVDQESIEKFESDLSNNLYKLWNRMCAGSYMPPPVRAVPIPKKTGGVRILGVPTVADRVAQTAVKLLLEPQLDPLFHDDSYGYRPGRSALDAVGIVVGDAQDRSAPAQSQTQRAEGRALHDAVGCFCTALAPLVVADQRGAHAEHCVAVEVLVSIGEHVGNQSLIARAAIMKCR
jgi:hypothetical protein